MSFTYSKNGIDFAIDNNGTAHSVAGKLTASNQPDTTARAEHNGFPTLINAMNIDWNNATYSYVYTWTDDSNITHTDSVGIVISDTSALLSYITYAYIASGGIAAKIADALREADWDGNSMEPGSDIWTRYIDAVVGDKFGNNETIMSLQSAINNINNASYITESALGAKGFTRRSEVEDLLNSYVTKANLDAKVDERISANSYIANFNGKVDAYLGTKGFVTSEAFGSHMTQNGAITSDNFATNFDANFSSALSNSGVFMEDDFDDAWDDAWNNSDAYTTVNDAQSRANDAYSYAETANDTATTAQSTAVTAVNQATTISATYIYNSEEDTNGDTFSTDIVTASVLSPGIAEIYAPLSYMKAICYVMSYIDLIAYKSGFFPNITEEDLMNDVYDDSTDTYTYSYHTVFTYNLTNWLTYQVMYEWNISYDNRFAVSNPNQTHYVVNRYANNDLAAARIPLEVREQLRTAHKSEIDNVPFDGGPKTAAGDEPLHP